MKRAVSILLISILAICSACGQNRPAPTEGGVADSAQESTVEGEAIPIAENGDQAPSFQGAEDDTAEKDVSEDSEAATESGDEAVSVLSEEAGTDMESGGGVEFQQETALENAPSVPESPPEPSITEGIDMADDTKAVPGNDGMYAVNITVGNRVFAARFYDNESARVLIDQMPMALDMRDYAGQEKVIALGYDFPSATGHTPPTIRTGDLYLYSGSSLVLFYTTFSNSYSYVPIGYIVDTTGLASALGDGNVLAVFRV